MEPVTMGIMGASLAGGLLQTLNAQQANAATAAERARIQALVDKIKDPQFNMTQITPEEFQVIGKYAPQMVPVVQEAAPQLVQRTAAGQQGQDAMLNALQRLRTVGQTGADAESQALIEQAQRNAAIQNQGQQASIMDDAARRGFAPGSGLAFAQVLNAQQGANQSAATSGTNAALAAYQNRLQALRDSANLGGQIDQNDQNLSSRNAGIINDFNARMANLRNQNAQMNTNALNDAQKTNLAVAQNTADKNTSLRNNAKYEQRDFANNMAQQQFNNQLNKVGVQTGNMNAGIQDDRNAARDRANNIQGTMSGISSGLLYQGQNDLEDQRYNRYINRNNGGM